MYKVNRNKKSELLLFLLLSNYSPYGFDFVGAHRKLGALSLFSDFYSAAMATRVSGRSLLVAVDLRFDAATRSSLTKVLVHFSPDERLERATFSTRSEQTRTSHTGFSVQSLSVNPGSGGV